ncbi:tRNA (adenosine(37)-N6)-threonylcarbamoyltransferase complex ATPase subunit type 1 TsaE [Denitratisoma sp. DHT3]|uniref:tRNA (adenosine(37)-N6)-threonylcarbamoyltransferase complex ATPase subunit type 1 TsaE n=1 Tax=Denitratisoma sp. DHT3 TaxID=1981880 RepID=UPI0011986C4E|nr:tRNA (adenosine(37)-N6)-threonylcarbamoyltransferase complex ATPase subunit type 1 TsaE [Denitratisoma sp. DHT3]QDX80842.1 tRNA (adenosine(37)-N6)-threonylcarbamoyltransferase complex ATPase subunit type 1 TsaE [Denitratisoma sp. DHT3]
MHDADHNCLELDLPDENATLALGAALASVLTSALAAGLLIYLEGDLGAGKTTLVRGLLRALGYPGRVKSPTYTLVEVHEVSGLNLYHFDFYRLNQPEEYLDAGLDEYFAGNGVCLVEWPDKAGPYLPAADLRVMLDLAGEGRRACLAAGSERGRQCLAGLTNSPLAGSRAATSSSSPPPA